MYILTKLDAKISFFNFVTPIITCFLFVFKNIFISVWLIEQMNQWTNMFILHVFCYGRSWYLIMLFKNKTFNVKWCHIVDVPTFKTFFWFLFQFHSWNSKIQPYSISCKFSATLITCINNAAIRISSKSIVKNLSPLSIFQGHLLYTV